MDQPGKSLVGKIDPSYFARVANQNEWLASSYPLVDSAIWYKVIRFDVCFVYFVLYLFLTLLFGFVLAFLFVCLFVCEFSNSVCPCKFVGQRKAGVCQEKLWSTEHSAVGGDPWFYWEVYVFSGGLSQELCHGTEPIILWNSTGVRAAITGTCAYYSNWAKVLILGKNRWNSACSSIYICEYN